MSENRKSEALLRLDDVSKSFMGLKAVSDLSLSVPHNGIVGLIGPNGAGKSTTFNLITKIYESDEGEITFNGQSLRGKKPHEIASLGIQRTFQNIRLLKNLTVIENVLVALDVESCYNIADVLFKSKRYRACERRNYDRACELLKMSEGLYERRDDVSDALPYGLQRKLEITRAMARGPKILLMDEPAAGMNGTEKQQLKAYIAEIMRGGVAVLLIEHDMSFVMDICEHVVVLNFGKKIAEGNPEAIQQNQDVIEAYLGRRDNAAN